MRFCRLKSTVRLLATSLLLLTFVAGLSRAARASATAFLPTSFAGWELVGKPEVGSDPRQLDPTNLAVLQEDHLTASEIAHYRRGERTLTVKAARFADAMFAYAAFTFYRQPRMQPETIGTLGASLNEHVLFFAGNTLVEAQFDRLTAMSGAQLRELASLLPQIYGPQAVLPSLPTRLPQTKVAAETTRYVLGPAAYAALNLDVPRELVDFDKSPEVVTADLRDGGRIVLVSYPTPHLAMDKISAFTQLAAPAGGLSLAKRSGPIIALVRGTSERSAAEHILAGINYDANVTWNEDTGLSKRDNIGNLVVAALTLVGILLLMSIGAGLVFGLGRYLLPHRRKSGPHDDEMIHLDLR